MLLHDLLQSLHRTQAASTLQQEHLRSLQLQLEKTAEPVVSVSTRTSSDKAQRGQKALASVSVEQVVDKYSLSPTTVPSLRVDFIAAEEVRQAGALMPDAYPSLLLFVGQHVSTPYGSGALVEIKPDTLSLTIQLPFGVLHTSLAELLKWKVGSEGRSKGGVKRVSSSYDASESVLMQQRWASFVPTLNVPSSVRNELDSLLYKQRRTPHKAPQSSGDEAMQVDAPSTSSTADGKSGRNSDSSNGDNPHVETTAVPHSQAYSESGVNPADVALAFISPG